MGCPITRSLEKHFSVDNLHRDRAETFPVVRYDILKFVTSVLQVRPESDLAAKRIFFPVSEGTIGFPSRVEVFCV